MLTALAWSLQNPHSELGDAFKAGVVFSSLELVSDFSDHHSKSNTLPQS